MAANRPPDFTMSIARKTQNEERGPFVRVGVAWANPTGSISIKLNAGVVLDWRMCDEFGMYLFPNDPARAPQKPGFPADPLAPF